MNKLEAEFNLGKGQSMEDLPEIFDCDICVTSGRGGSTLFMDGKEYHSEVIDIEEVDDDTNKLTFIDRRKYTVNVKGDKSPDTLEVPSNKLPSFKEHFNKY